VGLRALAIAVRARLRIARPGAADPSALAGAAVRVAAGCTMACGAALVVALEIGGAAGVDLAPECGEQLPCAGAPRGARLGAGGDCGVGADLGALVRWLGADRGRDHVHRRGAVRRRPPLHKLAAGPVRPGVDPGVARRGVAQLQAIGERVPW
jgi:hypothetical protein